MHSSTASAGQAGTNPAIHSHVESGNDEALKVRFLISGRTSVHVHVHAQIPQPHRSRGYESEVNPAARLIKASAGRHSRATCSLAVLLGARMNTQQALLREGH